MIGGGFSAGERQLITFARALVRDPRILVLDEATANIDSETEWIIQRGIERLSEGRTTFMIAHRLSTIREADQIMVLERGRIVEREHIRNFRSARVITEICCRPQLQTGFEHRLTKKLQMGTLTLN